MQEKDPLNLKQLADDISLLTSSVLTDATDLAREDEKFMKQTENLFSDTSTVMTFDEFTNETENKVYDSFVPSTSDRSSDPSLLRLDETSKSSSFDIPELKAIDDLLSDSFFSLSALEDSSRGETGTGSKSSKSSPFSLLLEEHEAGDKESKTLFSHSGTTSSSSSPLQEKTLSDKDQTNPSVTSTLLDSSDDDLIDNFLESFEGSLKSGSS